MARDRRLYSCQGCVVLVGVGRGVVVGRVCGCGSRVLERERVSSVY